MIYPRVFISVRFLSIILLFSLIFTTPTTNACTVFNKSEDGKVLFGNVENDSPGIVSEIHFVPPNESLGKYGHYFILGESGNVAGGMNDQGLCFDVAAYPSHPTYNGKPHGDLISYLLQDCATVSEAISFFSQYYWPGHNCNHIMIMDKTGSSAIVELIYGVLYVYFKDGASQVITNYSITDPEIRYGDYPCGRFLSATAQLDTASVTINNFQEICESVHHAYYNALYATIYNPISLDIYFFNPNINGSQRTHFNLINEMNKGEHHYVLKNNQIQMWQKEYVTDKFSISENAPNPFNKRTSFTLNLEIEAEINICLYDFNGIQVACLEDGLKNPGKYDYTWQSASFTSGMYFCKINIDGIIETRKWLKR